MASINDIYGTGTSIRASDLPAGIQVPVVIQAVRPLQFDDGNKLELTFLNKEKVLICNKTNASAIAEQHGDDFSLWVGKSIFLLSTTTDYQGKIVPCVRVALNPVAQPASQLPLAPAAQGVPAAQTQAAMRNAPNDEIPF